VSPLTMMCSVNHWLFLRFAAVVFLLNRGSRFCGSLGYVLFNLHFEALAWPAAFLKIPYRRRYRR